VLEASLGPDPTNLITIGLLALAALLIHHDRLGSQLLARSILWANFLIGTCVSIGNAEAGVVDDLGADTFSLGTALLLIGRLGLDEREGSVFRPVAFRTSLTLGMIMAVADAHVLACLGIVELDSSEWPRSSFRERLPHATMLFISGAVLVCAITGLYRLRVWGLVLASLGAAGVCVLSLANVYGLPSRAGSILALTSAVQVALSVPVFVAILGGRPVTSAPAPSWPVRFAPAALILLMMSASAIMPLLLG
jgi:hypothetical protein